MAIVIPSKNIYSINFDPVIDNNISKIEANETSINIYDNKNVEVYSKEFTSNGKLINNNIMQKMVHYLTNTGTIKGATYIGELFRVKYRYNNITIKIPQKKFNETIYKIYDGVYTDENGEEKTHIQLSIKKYIHKFPQVSGTAHSAVNSSTGALTSSPGYSVRDDMWTLSETVSEMPKSIRFYETKIYEYGDHNSNNYIGLEGDYVINENFNIPDNENIKTQKIIFDAQKAEYSITLQLLTEVILYKLSGYLAGDDYNMAKTQGYALIPLYGAEKYVLDKIKFIGDKYEVDLQEQTAIIGSGNKVFSFDGNELIQTTNTPTQESKYQGIIDKWKNGKQTAVISCPIADYYDENGNKVVDITQSGKMIFKEGDIVIPYIYTNKGDKPLSYNKNLSPKQFKVVGTKILENQGGTQELTLQEI